MPYNTLINNFIKDFDGFKPSEIEMIEHSAYLQHAKVGTVLLDSSKSCSQVYFVVKGRIRLYRILPDGKEITLYRIRENEICLFSLSCILDHVPLDAIAHVETETELLVLPENVVMALMDQNRAFRNFLFKRLLEALSEVMFLVEELTFQSMNQRLARYLLSHMADHHTHHRSHYNCVRITHERIAQELGTAREVVSRLLKEFESELILELSRGRISVIDTDKLKKIATM